MEHNHRLESPYRTHTCLELRKNDLGKEVRLAGWVHSRRDHGQIVFLDLRDHYGITQIVLENQVLETEAFKALSSETVISVKGKVVARSKENTNSQLPTGEIEVVVNHLEILSKASPLPFPVNKDQNVSDALRLKYRFLDLRGERIHKNVILRSKVASEVRKKMIEMGFNEIQTPILTSSSPEGARDFLVPSRLHPGKFYALPQAPQQFKQLLMVSGFDRYFQIAPCFRDEDARADRSPGEFYQIDVEMSYVTQDDVFKTIEELMDHVFKVFSPWPYTKTPFPRIPYLTALKEYGTDKPDLRIPQKIIDVTDIFAKGPMEKLRELIAQGSVARMFECPKTSQAPRKVFDDLIEFVKGLGGHGMMYLQLMEDGTFKGTLSKFMDDNLKEALLSKTKAQKGSTLFMVSGEEKLVSKIMGQLRIKLADDYDLREKDIYKFCWIVDFPMYELNEGKVDFSHNPFSMPQGGYEALMTKNPLEILAYQYDIVCNGIELSSGAIRNHRPEIMYKAFEIAGYTKDDVDQKFGGMINAFQYGAPPHGGIAPGFDRLVMLLANEPNIREIIPFPMNNQAEDLLMGAPSTVTEKQLRELSIKLNVPPVKT